MSIIAKARGYENTPVKAPIYQAPIGTKFSNIVTYPVQNATKANLGNSCLALLGVGDSFSDINGVTCRMVLKNGDDEYLDTVRVVGETARAYNVEIDGTVYSVQKSAVRFISGE